jgi:hypothetical protein
MSHPELDHNEHAQQIVANVIKCLSPEKQEQLKTVEIRWEDYSCYGQVVVLPRLKMEFFDGSPVDITVHNGSRNTSTS